VVVPAGGAAAPGARRPDTTLDNGIVILAYRAAGRS
jgi:hypothetical protein